ncbi:MAG: DUF4493 domain-containing protein [Alistipes sp.]|nr:DUF4493 domain-containing protein [Alistipes sp.]
MKMPRITTLFTAAAAVLLAGCMNEDLHIDNRNDKDAEKGYLSLAGLSVECVTDHKPVDTGVESKSLAATRAGEPDVNTFDCMILDATGTQTVKAFKYGARPTENIELDKGNYIFKMQSSEIPAAEWENPVYGLTEPFTITRNETTSLTDLVCKLLNIQVSVSYSADLKAALSDDTTTTITVGGNSLVFALNETRSGYFLAPLPKNDIDVLVKGSYKAEGKDEASRFEMNATIKDVKGGQYSDITLYIEYSTEGSIAIDAKIDGWVVDEEIVCDFSTFISENIIDDGENKPTITWLDNDIDTPVTLSEDKFDSRGNCLVDFYIDVEAKNTIASMLVEISSSNGEFMSSLGSYSLTSSFDLCDAGAAGNSLRIMGYPVNDEVKGKELVSFDLKPQMKLLKEFVGTHNFKATVKDAKGGTCEKTLSIVIPGEDVGPVIAWTGYDINRRYPIVDGMTVDITVDAPAGIKAFEVQIVSDTLTPQELAGVGLCDNINLVNPEDSVDSTGKLEDKSGIEDALKNFGFPTGSSVLNQTRVEFSITNFLGLLSFTGNGEHNFIMKVTDNDGVQKTKTLMLVKE